MYEIECYIVDEIRKKKLLEGSVISHYDIDLNY